MTRPFLLIILHFSHIVLTDGLTFIFSLLQLMTPKKAQPIN